MGSGAMGLMTFTEVSDVLEDVVRGLGDVPVKVRVSMRESGKVVKMTEEGLEERIPCTLYVTSGDDAVRLRVDYVRSVCFSDYAFGDRLRSLVYTLGHTPDEWDEMMGLLETTRESGWTEWYAISSKAYRQLMRDMNVIAS